MIKMLVVSSLLFSGMLQAKCIGEAQILGTVKDTVESIDGCMVFLTSNSEVKSSAVCSLDEEKLRTEGFEVGLRNGHDCNYDVGDIISGYIIDNGSYLYLEQ